MYALSITVIVTQGLFHCVHTYFLQKKKSEMYFFQLPQEVAGSYLIYEEAVGCGAFGLSMYFSPAGEIPMNVDENPECFMEKVDG